MIWQHSEGRRDLQFNEESEPWCGDWYSPHTQSVFAFDIIVHLWQILLHSLFSHKCSCCVSTHSLLSFVYVPITWSLYLVLGVSIMHLFVTFNSTALTGIILSCLCNLCFNLTNFHFTVCSFRSCLMLWFWILFLLDKFLILHRNIIFCISSSLKQGHSDV